MESATTSPVSWPTMDMDDDYGNESNQSNMTIGPMPQPTSLTPPVITTCLWMLVHPIGQTYIVPWDIFLLVPNALFFLMLVATSCRSVHILRRSSSPIVTTFYVLVFLTSFFSTARCIVIMFLGSFSALHNQLLWLVVRLFQLITELSVLLLGLLYGHADSKTGIRRVLAITVSLSVGYAVAQGVLEKLYHKVYFEQDLYLHGGLMFTLISSACFSLIYLVTTILPLLPLQRYNLLLPRKVSFYVYTALLCVLNITGCIGAALVDDCSRQAGFCLVSAMLFFYYGLFPALIYLVFLLPFFRTKQDTATASSQAPSETSGLLNCDYNVKPHAAINSSGNMSVGRDKRAAVGSTADLRQSLLSHGDSITEDTYGYGSVGDDGPLTPPNIYTSKRIPNSATSNGS